MDRYGGVPTRNRPLNTSQTKWPTLAVLAGTSAVFYFAKDVFLPFAIAVLLTFTLAPIVAFFRRLGFPRLVAIITSVAGSFLIVAVFSAILAFQVTEVGQNIAAYQYNIIEKIRALKQAGTEGGIFNRLNRFADKIGAEISSPEEKPVASDTGSEPPRKPVLVEIFSPHSPIETLENIIGPLISPLATTGLVVVVVIFMLLEREQLRDRFIRLVGYGDLHRTTEALQEAGRRVGQYLLMQLMVNIAYGIPLGIGLWLLGIPNALLWGMLAVVLRFVPYIGPVIAAVMPIFLAFAVSPGWMLLVWTIALFVVIELVSNNVIEPWLYGSRTGLSPLAIIVSAIFWAWLWGPVGLVLSTPLTVCLVVLGRHVPQFEFFEILFGDEPVLAPEERLYQRLLAGDPNEATDNAEEMLEEKFLVEYYGTVAIPALLIAHQDRVRGAMNEAQLKEVIRSANLLIDNLRMIANEELDNDEDVTVDTLTVDRTALELPPGEDRTVVCIGGHDALDDITAEMLGQVLSAQGAQATVTGHAGLLPSQLNTEAVMQASSVVVCYLDMDAAVRGRFSIRRLKRLNPDALIGVAIWSLDNAISPEEGEDIAARIPSDFLSSRIADVVINCLSDAKPTPLRPAQPVGVKRLPSKA
ncbi:AI-2E family transporter [Falsochrobactrum shanghaiense]|uniref:AI-2E family transporter n=1 Tax=Falsochrobactrum shanghaiense TaxID=2201899 RepID=A0A316J574_9HYPH|nr:AI-2E family transporter [Falsochrobactrum shanghaiense]PWL16318.1 AI-2E family transporter [Falsochrobactrum shanghaiense]